MKRFVWIGVGVALMAVAAPGARADQAAFAAKVKATEGLIGYWSFEGTYDDQSGKGNHAKAQGDTSKIAFVEGVKGGQGVQLDNEPQDGQFLVVAAPIGSVFDTPSQSVFVWAKSTGEQNIGDWENIIDRASLWYVDTAYTDVGGATKLDLVARIYTPSAPATAGSGQVRSSQASTASYGLPGQWHFYGFTYDGKVMSIYLDGKLAHKVDYTGGLGPTSETPPDAPTGDWNIYWGAWRGQSDHMHGAVDDTAIFSRALTADEVKALYDAMMQ